MSSLQVESILDTADLLNPHTMKKAADLLVKSRRTACFADIVKKVVMSIPRFETSSCS
jgi:DNA-binding MurR/RpiR family transcriptional regulator